MSSHHFVKEGQEPALLVCDPVAVHQVESLLEWAPLVVVLHTALHDVLLWGTKVDAVVVPVAEAPHFREQLQDQTPVEVVTYTPSEELLPVGLQYLCQKGQHAVNVVLEQPDKFFEPLQHFSDRLQIMVVDRQYKWSLVRSKYQKWMLAQQTLRVVKTSDSQMFSKTGLTGDSPAFTTVSAGMASLFSDGLFWVGEPL